MRKKRPTPTEHVRERLAVSPGEAAFQLRLGNQTIYDLCAAGELAFFYVGSRRLIPTASIAAFIERRIALAQAEPKRLRPQSLRGWAARRQQEQAASDSAPDDDAPPLAAAARDPRTRTGNF